MPIGEGPDHRTPDRDLWPELAAEAFDGAVLAFGEVVEGGPDAYAARRVLHVNQEGQQVSHTLVAADEEGGGIRPGVHIGGGFWWPYAIKGCYGCSLDCPDHGEELELVGEDPYPGDSD